METTFAVIDDKGVVQNVLVASKSFVESLPEKDNYVQTWEDAAGEPEKHFNFAEVGGSFDKVHRAFVDVQPYHSWVLNDKFKWEPPTPAPVPSAGHTVIWDGATNAWTQVPMP